jgi:serine/threonine protein kinase
MPVETAEDHVEKRLSSREVDEPEARARLRSEAALLARLSGLGVTPRLLASGEDARGPWLRTERIRLPTLAEHLARANAALPPEWIDRAVDATFSALALLHEAADAGGPLEIAHADLSPANIAIDEDASRALLLDLDLAWWREGPLRDRAFRGTIAYVAPEVARGERPTTQSDLFALAAALLHAATGAPPRSGSSFAALLAAAAEAPLVLDANLAARGRGHAALFACLAHAPADRPASARVVLAMARR